jgi:GH15 family glucan-1,4-alpha-glucosidase
LRAQGNEGAANLLSKPLEDYGLIGNMISAALVARDGSIDWLCLPRFDSPACFAALLGNAAHGRWRIAPQAAPGTLRCHRRYLPGTAVLETTFETDEGAVTLTDFMPLTDDESKVDVVRIVAFSHIGLINTAYNLIEAHGPAEQRAERAAPTGRAPP